MIWQAMASQQSSPHAARPPAVWAAAATHHHLERSASSILLIMPAEGLTRQSPCMQEAAGRVQGAARLLDVEGRGSRLASLQRQLVSRRCRLAASYGAVYSVGPKTGLPPQPLHAPRRRLAVSPLCWDLT